jgi:hypothetical protein
MLPDKTLVRMGFKTVPLIGKEENTVAFVPSDETASQKDDETRLSEAFDV